MLGQHQAKLRTANEPPSVIMIVGLQGSGKTTSTGKLARWLSKNGSSPMMVSVDVYRPAARKQLSILARDLKLPIYEGTPEETKPSIWRASARKEADSDRPRCAAGRYRRPPAHRRRPDDRADRSSKSCSIRPKFCSSPTP